MEKWEKLKENFPRISTKRYHQYKISTVDAEKENYDCIVLIPCSGDKNWYEMADHSALIYLYVVCKKLRRNVKLFPDKSHYLSYETGYIRSLGVEPIRKNLKKVGLYLGEWKSGDAVHFKLNVKYSEDEIEEFKKMEMRRRKAAGMPEAVGALNPTLHDSILKLTRKLYNDYNAHMNELMKITIGVDVVRLLTGILEDYHQLALMTAVPKTKIIAKYAKMRRAVYLLIVKVKVKEEIKEWDLYKYTGILESLLQIRDLIEEDIRTLQGGRKKGDEGEKGEEGAKSEKGVAGAKGEKTTVGEKGEEGAKMIEGGRSEEGEKARKGGKWK